MPGGMKIFKLVQYSTRVKKFIDYSKNFIQPTSNNTLHPSPYLYEVIEKISESEDESSEAELLYNTSSANATPSKPVFSFNMDFDFSSIKKRANDYHTHLMFIVVLILVFFIITMKMQTVYSPDTSSDSLQKTPHEPTMYLVLVGDCSMSSPIRFFARKLLEAYGIKLALRTAYWEVGKSEKNLFWESGTSFAESLEKYMDTAKKDNSSLLLKITPAHFFEGLDQNKEAARKLLKNIRIKWIFATRGNNLDTLICRIRDCFDTKSGYVVLAATGEKTELCFKRRLSTEEVKAYLDPSRFMQTLKSYVNRNMQHKFKILEWFGFDNFVQIKTERLFHFEYGEEYRDESVLEWTKLLNYWGLFPDRKVISTIMDAEGPPRRQEKPHSMTVYNMDFLREQAKKYEVVKKFLRD